MDPLLLPIMALPDAPEPSAFAPVHVVYGGAHLFKRETPQKLGQLALAALDRFAPDPEVFGAAFGVEPSVRARVAEKLRQCPVEDLRVDFEDGFGVRSDTEEDAAVDAAAVAMAEGNDVPAIGIRIKALTPGSAARAARTLDRFCDALLRRASLPAGFVVTLPKVDEVVQVRTLVALLRRIEARHGLRDPIPVELMVETPAALAGPDGRCPLPALVDAGEGRVRGLHLGAYDLTSALGVDARAQTLDHPVNVWARTLLLTHARGCRVSDGATTLMPVPRHAKPADAAEEAENRRGVHAAWRLHADNIRAALRVGIHQGWDLHPAQLVARFAATFDWYRGGFAAEAERLRRFLERAAQATRVGHSFDDAATGRALVAGMNRAVRAGAVDPDELRAVGLDPDALALGYAAVSRASP
jgi:citrate lyase beta subunit